MTDLQAAASKGGKAAAAKMTSAERTARARRAAQSRWAAPRPPRRQVPQPKNSPAEAPAMPPPAPSPAEVAAACERLELLGHAAVAEVLALSLAIRLARRRLAGPERAAVLAGLESLRKTTLAGAGAAAPPPAPPDWSADVDTFTTG